ncbi:MAG: orotate phosphoribosyltransferase [Candidatus Aenigmarchaeota archaeon]|nr:orotate phosphoribosyltransferase [Candidatus Aenigmarchaeota archaeon]
MPIPGICQSCGKMSNALVICPYCGARVCMDCIDPRTGACKLCKGKVMRK